MFSKQCEGFAGVKQDAQAAYPVGSDNGGFSRTVIGDDALLYLSKRSECVVDPLFDFCVSCAIYQKDASKVFELHYCEELCFINFHNGNHEGALNTSL